MTWHERIALYDKALAVGDLATADAHIQAAIVAAPSSPDALWRYAQMLAHKNKCDEGAEFALRCVRIDPTNAKAWGILTGLYSGTGDVERVVWAAENALRLCPVYPLALWNYSHALLKMGEFKKGWDYYRWGCVIGQRRTRCVGQEWDGSPIPGKRLFVWSEQGFGDTIMALRFVRLAKEASKATVFCDVQPELIGLVEGQAGCDECYAQTPHMALGSEFDYHVSMMEIPRVLGLYSEKNLWSQPYIGPVKWAKVPDMPRGKTALVWKGSPSHPNDANRSIPDHEVARLEFKADWISLQHGGKPPFQCMHIGHGLSDFGFTASVLSNVDRVVTADTSVAHLAGAMGVPAIVVLPLNGEWRWGMEGSKSYWYDSVTLVRERTFERAIDKVIELLPPSLPIPKVAVQEREEAIA